MYSQIGRVKLTLTRSDSLGLSTSDLARYSSSTDAFVASLPPCFRISLRMRAAFRRRMTPSRVSGMTNMAGRKAPKMMIWIHCIQRHSRSGLASTQDIAIGAKPVPRKDDQQLSLCNSVDNLLFPSTAHRANMPILTPRLSRVLSAEFNESLRGGLTLKSPRYLPEFRLPWSNRPIPHLLAGNGILVPTPCSLPCEAVKH